MWSIRDVLAHVVGGANRFTKGNNGLLSDEDAHAEVLGLRDVATCSLIERLIAYGDLIEVQRGAPSLEWDLAVHLADVCEALGESLLPECLWIDVLRQAVAFLEHQTGVRLSSSSSEDEREGSQELVFANDYELFRALFSRRRGAAELQNALVNGSLELLDSIAFFH